MAVFFAFCCLACAAVNDFVFKLFARKERSRGMFVALVGAVWLSALLFFPCDFEENLSATLFWGTVSGIFSVAGNLLLIEAMGRESAGVCATVYRLNLVLVVIGAYLFLGENLNGLQAAGVVLAILAILAFFPGGRLHLASGFLMVAVAAAMRAGMGLSYKYGFLHGADRNGVVLVNALLWIAGGLLYAYFRENKLRLPNRKLLAYGMLSGVGVLGIVLFMALSLQYGAANVVLPIAQMSFLGTLGLSVLFLKERMTRRKTAAAACGVAAVLLLSLS